MSRSVKKTPFCKCERTCKWGKRNANRRVRRYKDSIPNGKWYKKIYNSWDICDYYSIETWKQYKEWFEEPFRDWVDEEQKSYYAWFRAYKGK